MAQSFQNEIPPARVNIRLSVDQGGESQKVELPLKLLVLGKFKTQEDSARLIERQKIAVHRENFDAVIKSMELNLQFKVPNRMVAEGDDLAVSMHIQSMRDFEPDQVVRQIPEMRRLIAARNLLRDLGSNLTDHRAFRRELESLLKHKESRLGLAQEIQNRIVFKEGGTYGF